RAVVLDGVGAALAVRWHDSAVVFLRACGVLAGARQVFDSSWGRQLGWHLAASLASPLALFAYLCITHGRRLGILGYLYDFYWRQTPGETLTGFLLRNFQNFWNLFALFEIENRNRAVGLSLAAFFGLSSAVILFRTRRSG